MWLNYSSQLGLKPLIYDNPPPKNLAKAVSWLCATDKPDFDTVGSSTTIAVTFLPQTAQLPLNPKNQSSSISDEANNPNSIVFCSPPLEIRDSCRVKENHSPPEIEGAGKAMEPLLSRDKSAP